LLIFYSRFLPGMAIGRTRPCECARNNAYPCPHLERDNTKGLGVFAKGLGIFAKASSITGGQPRHAKTKYRGRMTRDNTGTRGKDNESDATDGKCARSARNYMAESACVSNDRHERQDKNDLKRPGT